MDIRVAIYLIAPYLFVAICWLSAINRDKKAFNWYHFELLTAILFGFVLEWVGVHALNYYHYGHSLIKVFEIPLSTPIGWGVIIYSSMHLTDKIKVPQWTRPFLDSFFALQIDLSMDVVATRLKLWTWTYYPSEIKWDQDWFGVPWGNFFGWIFTVLFFSMIVRKLRTTPIASKIKLHSLIPLAVMIIFVSELLLVGALKAGEVLLWLKIPEFAVGSLPFLILGIPAFIGITRSTRTLCSGPSFWVPAFYHIYSYILLLATPLEHMSSQLKMASTLVFAVFLGVHFKIHRSLNLGIRVDRIQEINK